MPADQPTEAQSTGGGQSSPFELRAAADERELDTYHPGASTATAEDKSGASKQRAPAPTSGKNSTWISRFTSPKSRRHKLDRAPRLASLDSARDSSSSFELDAATGEHLAHSAHLLRAQPPLISITSNEAADQRATRSDYYGRPGPSRAQLGAKSGRHSRDGGARDEEDDEDEDFFESQLPTPYSSSAMSRSKLVTREPLSLDELLDDRQGMNSCEQQNFTKAEKAPRPSIDGSVISETFSKRNRPSDSHSGSSLAARSASGQRTKLGNRRSKSPSSSSVVAQRRQRHSRSGLLGIASRLKLTKKHESIARLQLSILNSRFVSLKTLDRDLQSFLPRERMSTKEFEARVKLMRRYAVLANIEYRFASRYETYVCKYATQESNQAKNNYRKCIPYDYNRVVLRTLPNVPDSDYINASHVDSCLKPNAYIAAQGPNENTIEDFWRMIWEQKTFVIVMLTKVFDFIRVMCNQYWPVELNKPERYGNLEVTLLYEEPLADFVIRTIKLTRLRASQLRQAEQQSAATGEAGDGPQPSASANKHEAQLTEDESAYTDEDTSASEELVLNPRADSASRQLPNVREPKFIRAAGGSRRREKSASPRLEEHRGARLLSVEMRRGSSHAERQARSSSQPPGSVSGRARTPSAAPSSLHPLSYVSLLNGSQNSLNNLSEPPSPVTPRTPSSAGLDRSSATRRAVKKKRRERVKNTRPRRTQFMVPSESQLLDDDELGDEQLAEEPAPEPGSAPADELLLEGDQAAGRASNERIIYQFHYNSWASHTCPFISSLLHFRRRVRICMDEMSKSGKTGPTVVHCNDGCGRTGTYLCIDANLELAEEDNVLDVYSYTRKMRQSRKFLIENLEQYRFVYDTIEEAMFCGKTWFPVSELHKQLKHKSRRNPSTKKNEYLREYEKITRMTSKFSIGDCAGGHRVENREKNRDVSTVPPDNFRPYLTSFQTNDSTDYINAVFVDGYTRSKEYIVTEWPLHRTISDFWSLVYDHDCNSVILLANPTESTSYPSFLPSEKELRRKFGPVFSAEMVSYTHYQNIKSWIYTINKKIVSLTEVIAGVKSEAKTTQVFQITCWPQGHRVPTSTNALVELMNMVERWRQRTTYGPVCVVSLNGKSRAGVYCAANVAIEQVVQHSEVDVFQAVKIVRRHRPQLIENMTEYKYCYDLILHYVLHYVNQSPTTT